MGGRISRTDYEWVYTDEPHATRRQLILAKYPQIKQLMRIDTNFKWTVLALVAIQIVSYYLLRNTTTLWQLFLVGYCFNGVINHSLILAIHEISHNQAFGNRYPMANKWFGIVANFPLGFPYFVSFKHYHTNHHQYLGVDKLDPDTPSEFEARIFSTSATKVLWLILQPLIYGLRPLIVNPKVPSPMDICNIVVQLVFDSIIGQTLGWHIVAYMVGSTWLAMGLHPMSAHFLSEHFIMFDDNNKKFSDNTIENGIYVNNGRFLVPDTCSYYGYWNAIAFNIGYHVEHHDFPSIPAKLLPKVSQIAPEFYDSLNHHTSYSKIIWQFIVDPKIGPYARVKRALRDNTS
ncbi:sphingolipid delta(4)-desaturase DES1-like [Oppia nitens]|uniref:sphingolipid delta(4)-desaturase DES1-like n=1 Tax=Oppia nitens TaxID=1686743 RepID=UPI0023DA6DBC|nr:sphingolipid delta(4)-desaturase DES1-like [Oppia nitens]